MSDTTSSPAMGRDAFLAPYVAAGYRPVEPAILRPAEMFLDVSGEELAKRLYTTTDADGREYCLRPEFTIPICKDHLTSGDPARVGAYCYHGTVFRHRPGASGEFVQAGLESLGRTDRAAADAEVFALALEGLAHHGLRNPKVRMGDVGLFRAVVDALDLPPAWRRRLQRDFGRADLVEADIASLGREITRARSAYAGVLSALSGADRAAARALVQDLLRIGGLATVGGRSVAEIADRFVEQADLERGQAVDPERLAVLGRLLTVSGNPDAMPSTLQNVLEPLGKAVSPIVEAFFERNEALRRAGVDLRKIQFDAAFGRRLDYYSGLVFEMHDPDRPDGPQVLGGGRYDTLLELLGAPEPSPGIGFAIWPERLGGG